MTRPPPNEVVIRLSQAESEAFAQAWRDRLMRKARNVGIRAQAMAMKAKGEI